MSTKVLADKKATAIKNTRSNKRQKMFPELWQGKQSDKVLSDILSKFAANIALLEDESKEESSTISAALGPETSYNSFSRFPQGRMTTAPEVVEEPHDLQMARLRREREQELDPDGTLFNLLLELERDRDAMDQDKLGKKGDQEKDENGH